MSAHISMHLSMHMSICRYYHVSVSVEPKRKALEQAKSDLEAERILVVKQHFNYCLLILESGAKPSI